MQRNRQSRNHIVLLTKADRVSNERLLKKIEEFSKYQDRFLSLIPVSIKKGTKREYILDEITKYLPIHPFLFDEDILTTENLREYTKSI